MYMVVFEEGSVHVLHFVHFAYVHTNVIVGKNEY
jgi:hypothetical protein